MTKAIIFDFFGVIFIRSGWEWKVDNELIDFVDKLHKNYKTALISNSSQTSARIILGEQGVIDMFDEIIVSDEVGVSKPQPEIFEIALKRLGVKPEEAVFIDDSAYNTDAAARSGIKPILYKDLASLNEELSKLGVNTD